MKHGTIAAFQMALGLLLILHGDGAMGKALTPEDVKDLLPPSPRDKNETMAVVVQDPVVQDAVNRAAGNGSLNALVVKKHVYIMPATNPRMVLSKREHLLVVPTENLEDVRKNITEAKQAEAGESSTSGNEAYLDVDSSEYSSEIHAESSTVSPADSYRTMPSNEKRKSETEFLEHAVNDAAALPDDRNASTKKVAVPIVAVIDPSKAENGKVNSPIVAILPNRVNNGPLNDQVQFLTDNRDTIQRKAQDFVDRTSITVNPDYWISSSPSQISVASSTAQEDIPASLFPVQPSTSAMATNEIYLTPMMVPRWKVLSPASLRAVDRADYPADTGDMEVAEDIIFRPLFRYRQESQQRSKYYDDSNRRHGYGYGYASYYPRRPYFSRPRYDDY